MTPGGKEEMLYVNNLDTIELLTHMLHHFEGPF